MAESRVQHMEHQLKALDKADGWGVLRGTPAGEAAIAWTRALGEWRWCTEQAKQVGWRERHRLLHRADRAAEQEGPLRDAYQQLAAPERARLRAELPEAKKELADLEGRYYGHVHFQIAHPEALRRVERLDNQIATAAWEMDVERRDLDGIAPQRPELPEPARGFDRFDRVLERGIELEL